MQNLAPSLPMDKKTELGGLGGLGGLDSALQEQERIITMSYALASEASLKSKQVTGAFSAPPPGPLRCSRDSLSFSEIYFFITCKSYTLERPPVMIKCLEGKMGYRLDQ